MGDRYVIRYDSQSVTDGIPVGTVYVTTTPISKAIRSYTKDGNRAALFTRQEAEQEIARARWNNAAIIPSDQAYHL